MAALVGLTMVRFPMRECGRRGRQAQDELNEQSDEAKARRVAHIANLAEGCASCTQAFRVALEGPSTSTSPISRGAC
jgi:hypothetical protein